MERPLTKWAKQSTQGRRMSTGIKNELPLTLAPTGYEDHKSTFTILSNKPASQKLSIASNLGHQGTGITLTRQYPKRRYPPHRGSPHTTRHNAMKIGDMTPFIPARLWGIDDSNVRGKIIASSSKPRRKQYSKTPLLRHLMVR